MKLITIFSLTTLPILTLSQSSANDYNFIGSTPSQRLAVNQTQAQTIINAAVAQAINISSPSNIAVTDPSGLLVGFLRMDNAFPASIDISQKKARTVSLFNGYFTTAALGNVSQPGQSLYGIEITNGGLILFGGGVPIYSGQYFIGAVGVSGGTVDQDVIVATAGVTAVGALKPS